MSILKAPNASAILNNIKKIFETGNINFMTTPTYHFLMNVSGFIAHYDINGFKYEYEDVIDLIDQLKNTDLRWGVEHYSTYGVKEYGEEYGMAMSKIYEGIIDLLKNDNYRTNNKKVFDEKVSSEFDCLKSVVNELGEKDNSDLKAELLKRLSII